jgi:hypothetical protein
VRHDHAPGSYLAISHGTADLHAAATVSRATAAYDRATAPLVLRSHAQISMFLDSLELIDPGLVQVPLWRPDHRPPDLRKIAIYGAVGRKLAGSVDARPGA